MRKIILHRQFVKSYKKLPQKIKTVFKERRSLFLDDETSPLLKIHDLQGDYVGYRSFNVNADVRVIFKETELDVFLFTDIGTHSQLYS